MAWPVRAATHTPSSDSTQRAVLKVSLRHEVPRRHKGENCLDLYGSAHTDFFIFLFFSLFT